MADFHDTFGNPTLRGGIPIGAPIHAAPLAEQYWPLSKNRRALIVERLRPLVDYVASAPASDPGEGDWESLEGAFGAGENSAIYAAAEMVRGVLLSLGLDAPAGVSLTEFYGHDD